MAKQKMSLEEALAHVVRLNEAGQFQQSLHLARQVSSAAPKVAMVHNVHSAAAEAAGELDEAIRAARTAIELSPGMVDAHYNLGTALRRKGDYNAAIAAFRQARKLAPGDRDVIYNLSVSLQEVSQFRQAADGFRTLLDANREDTEAALGLALSLSSEDHHDEADALALVQLNRDPADTRFWRVRFDALRRRNDVDGLAQLLGEASSHLGEDDAFVALADAHVLRENKQLAAARDRLNAVTGPEDYGTDYAIAHAELLGKLNDQLGDTEAAFGCFSTANQLGAAAYGGRMAERDAFDQRMARQAALFSQAWVNNWPAVKGQHSNEEPVLLIGFPRSGTTLLDTILMSHSQVSVLEEQPVLSPVITAARKMLDDDLAGLAKLDEAQLSELQSLYLERLESFRPDGDTARILINKMPLNMVEAGLVYRLFSKAKFLLALRHPCDCVLSCYMQQFKLNAAMAHFVDIELAARFYHDVFSLWEQYLSVLPITVYTVRYEDLISGFDETISPVMDFLGLEWEDAVRDYIATAKERGRISTPSFNQVTQPLYTSSRGRWEKYREQMAPALPVLEPWARKFGYEM
jgi:tetratricopeptide (TPR) repeat protein